MRLPVLSDSSDQTAWYAQGLQFTCSQCGNCCTGGPGFVWISDEEIRRLAEHLKLSAKQVLDRYCRKFDGRISLNETRTPQGMYDCVFLKEDPERGRKTCSIYPVRPLQCRTWPFWPENLADRARWDRAALRCHGMNHGRKFTLPQLQSIRDAKDWPNNPPTSAKRRAVSVDAPSP
jgi:Fe-S-cluster containining protein